MILFFLYVIILLYGDNFMNKIQMNDLYDIEVYDNQDYIENNKHVNDCCADVLSTHERNIVCDVEKSKEFLDNMNYDMYLNNLVCRVYLLKRDDEPMSYAIYTKTKNDANWKLEQMYTNQEFTGLGYATVLLRASADDMKRNGVKNLCMVFSKQNIPANKLAESFDKVAGIRSKMADVENIKKCIFNVENMKLKATKEQVEEMLF